MSKITLEQVEELMEKSGLGYPEVKAALEAADGDVEAALATLMEAKKKKLVETDRLEDAINYVKGLLDKGLAAKLVIKKGDDIVLNIPAGLGLVGILAPFLSVAGLGTAILTGHSINIELKDGEVVNVNEYVDKAYHKVKETGEQILKEDETDDSQE